MLPAHLLMWSNLILYFGPLRYLETRTNGAAVLMVGLYRPFLLRVDGGVPLSCRCAVVAAGVPHEVDVQGGVLGKLFIERDSEEYWRFVRFTDWRIGQRLACLDDPGLLRLFVQLYEEAPAKDEVLRRLLAWLPALPEALPSSVDARLRPVFSLIRRHGEENHGQARLTQLAHLSASRLQHLFRAETGMSYRGFRIWKRLILAASHLQRSDCLTRSALDAGFADASHFSHCYKRYLGASPAQVFRSLQRFEC